MLVGISPQYAVTEVGPECRPEYGRIPIAFMVESQFRVRELGPGLGFGLVEEPVAPPHLKDYDALDARTEGPSGWLARFDTSNWGFFLVRHQGQPVGGAVVAYRTPAVHMLEGRDDLAVLWDIRVHPEHRRQGIGAALFASVVEWARARRCRQLKVETQNTNVPACRFYARQGCVLGAINRFGYAGCPEVAHETLLLWYLDLAQQAAATRTHLQTPDIVHAESKVEPAETAQGGRAYPVTRPVRFEKLLFDWKLPVLKPWAWFGDWQSGCQRESDWTTPDAWRMTFDIQKPEDWKGNHVLAWLAGEWYAHVLRGCRRLLDVGCQDGRPSLYLAQYIPEVLGIDVDKVALERARRAARLGGRTNVRFEVADVQNLPYPDGNFDGVSFGAAFAYPGTDPEQELREIRRVLAPGGVLASFTFHLYEPPDAQEAPDIGRFYLEVDSQGRPFVHCWVESASRSRLYRVYLRRDSELGRTALRAASNPGGPSQSLVEELRSSFVSGDVPRSTITEVYFTGEEQSSVHVDPERFERLLLETGFSSITSWFLPDEVEFADALEREGVLGRLRQEDLLGCLRALVRSAKRRPGCHSPFVSCTRP